jgi:hypothetical protein
MNALYLDLLNDNLILLSKLDGLTNIIENL